MKIGLIIIILLSLVSLTVIADNQSLNENSGFLNQNLNESKYFNQNPENNIPPPIEYYRPNKPKNISNLNNPDLYKPAGFPEDIRRDNELPGNGMQLQNWQLPVVSGGVSLIILAIILIASITSGSLYQFQASRRARVVLAICHFISAIIISAFVIVLTIIGSSEDYMDPLISTIYAVFGIVIYLALSSFIQAISLIKDKPLIPLPQAHILFAVISIILLLSIRIPGGFNLPVSIIIVSTTILPGTVFSLLTTYYIHKPESRRFYTNGEETVTRELPVIHQDLPPSFPEKLTAKYHDIQVVGSGGMAVVYRGTRNSDGLTIALKIPVSADETSGKTFLNEMSVWRDLSHPNIVSITDQNIFPVPYVELEYLPRSLKDITLPVPPARAISIVSQIGSALLYAHEKGVIHRDIKPGNVLLNDEGQAKLTDWGLSRFLERRDDTRNTSFSLFYATPEQLSPDQYGNGDQRTDIYQLGVLLYELICGDPPYGTQSIGELFTRIQKNEYILPSKINSNLSCFDEIITRTLKANPSDRIQSVKEFLSLLESIRI